MLILIAVAGLVALLSPTAALAQSDSVSLEEVYGDPVSIPLADAMDSMYDYELYIAKPGTDVAWYVEYAYENGKYWYSGAFASYEDARKYRDRQDWNGIDPSTNDWVDPDNLFTTTIFEGVKEPDWRYHETYGTLAEAEDVAAEFEALGLLTEIRRVSTLRRGTAGKTTALR